jgi:uncharacterized protein with HEPN domain
LTVTAALPSKKISRYLTHIVENADRIASYLKGMDEQAFLADEKTQDAVERCLQRLIEAADRIKKQNGEQLLPGLPWKSVQALGNRLRHEYDQIDAARIWSIAQTDLEPLKEQSLKALESLNSPASKA